MNRKKLAKKISVGMLVLATLVFASTCGWSAEKPYAGKELVVAVEAGVMALPLREFVSAWEDTTGAKVRVVELSTAVVHSKLMMELKSESGVYDVINCKPMWMGDFAKYLLPLDIYIEEVKTTDPDWYSGFLPIQEISNIWGDKILGVQTDGDVVSLYYRKDLFSYPEERATFQRRYGYELDVSLTGHITWDQYLDIAEFFTRKPGEKLAGETLAKPFYGTAELGEKWALPWWFLARYIAYSAPTSYLFDPDSMEPLINSPAGVRAMRNFVDSIKFSPPGVLSYGYLEYTSEFLTGNLAMELMWPDLARWGSDPEQSKVMGKIGFALPPAAPSASGGVRLKSLMAPGHNTSIVATTENPEMAFDFIKGFTQPDVSLDTLLSPQGGYDPFRIEHIQSERLINTVVDGEKYLENHMKCLRIGWPDLKITGAEEFYDKIAVNAGRALQGEISPEEAVNNIAEEWKQIVKRRGLEELRSQYRKSLGFLE